MPSLHCARRSPKRHPPNPVVLNLVGDHKRADFVVLRQLVDIIGRHLFADALGYVRRWC